MLDELRFTGLRRIAPAAVVAQLSSHAGDRFDPTRLERDIRALARLGWFESIRVEATSSTAPFPQLPDDSNNVILIFHMKELPFLSKSRVLGLPAVLAKTDRKNAGRQKTCASSRQTG